MVSRPWNAWLEKSASTPPALREGLNQSCAGVIIETKQGSGDSRGRNGLICRTPNCLIHLFSMQPNASTISARRRGYFGGELQGWRRNAGNGGFGFWLWAPRARKVPRLPAGRQQIFRWSEGAVDSCRSRHVSVSFAANQGAGVLALQSLTDLMSN